jgi:tetratricopeptide (TPR) repeat protein
VNRRAEAWAETLLSCLSAVFILYFLPWGDLLAPTITAGGDMASHYYPTKLMHEEILPYGRLTGWTMGNYAGFPIFHFYSILPFAVIGLLGYVFPMEQTFKLVTLLGPITTPLAAAYLFRSLGYSRGAPIIAAASTLPFLFQQGNSMWGGNIPSVLAGEFCHSIGLSLSLVYLGALHRTVAGRGSWLICALLLASIGLSHAFSFIGALWFSLFYLWPRRDAEKVGPYLVPIFGLTFLLLAFWGLPLPPRLQFTTEFSMIWRLKAWTEVLPELLWPALGLSIANLLLLIPRPPLFRDLPVGTRVLLTAVGAAVMVGVVWANDMALPVATAWRIGFAAGVLIAWIGLPRHPFAWERQGLLVFVLAGSGFLYLIAPALGFPDIRFVPIGQLFIGLLAADCIAWAGSQFRHKLLFATIALTLCCAWSWHHLGYLPSWLTWNYSGYEQKGPWPVFKGLNDHLAGTIEDPRVVFEHAQDHNRFGSSRAFENLPLFSGRPTLEGVFHQVSPNSAFVFYLQSQTSEKTSGPFPQHTYTRLNPEHALGRLKTYNVGDLVVVSEKARAAYAANPAYEKTYEDGGYEIYHVESAITGYVVAAENQPVLYEGPDHKLAFFRWFKHDDLLDIPVVAAKHVDQSRLSEFAYRTDAIERLPRVPYDKPCNVSSQIEQYRISIQTECPGRPHIVKVSYFPRWQTSDGSPLDFVAPGFMLVYPETETLEIVYGRTPLDWFSLSLSWLGLAVVLICGVSRGARSWAVVRFGGLFQPLFRTSARFSLPLGLGLLIVLIGSAAATRNDLTEPDRAFRLGQEAYRERDFATAVSRYSEWTRIDRDTFKQATALFQLGVAQAELGNHAQAVQTLERLRFQFPNVNYGPGTLFHLTQSYAALELTNKARETAAVLATEHAETAWVKRLARENPELLPPDAEKN